MLTAAFRVSIVARCTGSSVERLRVTVAAGSAAVINAPPAFVRNPGMRTSVRCIPVVCCVAACTIQAKHTGMEDRVAVTARTIRRQPRELARGMAAFTSQSCMRASQRKVTQIMVEGGVMPIGWIMAGSAVRAILAIMFVVLLVAGKTICGRGFVLVIQMAGFTSHVRVFSLELECSQVVIELCGRPAIRSMTLTAIHSEATLVRVVVMVTGITILEGHCKVAKAARIEVALHTGKTFVFSCQLERRDIVVEILPEAVHAIVTVEAGGTER